MVVKYDAKDGEHEDALPWMILKVPGVSKDVLDVLPLSISIEEVNDSFGSKICCMYHIPRPAQDIHRVARPVRIVTANRIPWCSI